jgi:hypothetical protein
MLPVKRPCCLLQRLRHTPACVGRCIAHSPTLPLFRPREEVGRVDVIGEGHIIIQIIEQAGHDQTVITSRNIVIKQVYAHSRALSLAGKVNA